MTYSPEARAEAKRDGVYLVKVEINGQHVKEGPCAGGNMKTAGAASTNDVRVLQAVLLSQLSAEIPRSEEDATWAALANLVHGLTLSDPGARSRLLARLHALWPAAVPTNTAPSNGGAE